MREHLKGSGKIAYYGRHKIQDPYCLRCIPQVHGASQDAIAYVRANYCVKAVESSEQVKFLVKHFGITSVAGAKEHSGGKGKYSLGVTSIGSYLDTQVLSARDYLALPLPKAKASMWGNDVEFIFDKQEQPAIITV